MSRFMIHRGKDIAAMRKVGQMAAECLAMVGPHLRPGVTTDEINTLVHEFTLKQGGTPAPLNYRGFPKSVCVSVNEVVCHGIPGPLVLNDGDIVNVDVTTIFPRRNGFHGDTSATFYIGEPGPLAQHVTEVCRQALELGLEQVRPGAYTGDIGAAIQEFVEAKGCSVVREYTGHGIGRIFHAAPNIQHYGTRGTGVVLRKGMTFTIEPMVNLGSPEIEHLDDDWTVVTKDGTLTAQFEHTVIVTRSGCEVLTARTEPLVNSEDRPYARLGPLASFVAEPAAESAK